jgi:2-keto-3-deoxy-6-phosphogluconate aldolase
MWEAGATMMKFLAAALFGVGFAAVAQAAPSQSCIRAGDGVSRVAALVETPADCCSGRMKCAQFLSTTIVARPSHPERT